MAQSIAFNSLQAGECSAPSSSAVSLAQSLIIARTVTIVCGREVHRLPSATLTRQSRIFRAFISTETDTILDLTYGHNPAAISLLVGFCQNGVLPRSLTETSNIAQARDLAMLYTEAHSFDMAPLKQAIMRRLQRVIGMMSVRAPHSLVPAALAIYKQPATDGQMRQAVIDVLARNYRRIAAVDGPASTLALTLVMEDVAFARDLRKQCLVIGSVPKGRAMVPA